MPARNDELRDALKRAASALKAQGPEFALAGSYALWVHGGPEPVHDVDFVVAEEAADSAAKTLEDAGFRIDRPPEDWLFKACTGDVVVDMLHRLNGVPVDPATIPSGWCFIWRCRGANSRCWSRRRWYGQSDRSLSGCAGRRARR